LGSKDGTAWEILIDKSDSSEDTPHDYVQLQAPANIRYVRLVNVHVPFGGNFAVRELRVFGKGAGEKPKAPEFSVERNPKDGREATISWKKDKSADAYVIRYGIKPDELFQSQQIYGKRKHQICSLTCDSDYFFTLDSFNANGYSFGTDIKHLKKGVDLNMTKKTNLSTALEINK